MAGCIHHALVADSASGSVLQQLVCSP